MDQEISKAWPVGRRKNVRFRGKKESILLHQNGPHPIKDISVEGLSFQCPLDECFASQWPVEILLAGTSLYIALEVRLIHERMNDVVSFIATPTKEVGVEFLNLDTQHRLQINKMLAYLEESSDEGQPFVEPM